MQSRKNLTDEQLWAIVTAPDTTSVPDLARAIGLPADTVGGTRRRIRQRGWTCRVWYAQCAGCDGWMTFHRDRPGSVFHPACLDRVRQARPWDASAIPSPTHSLTVDEAAALAGIKPGTLRHEYLSHLTGPTRDARISPAEVRAVQQLRAGNGRPAAPQRLWTDAEIELVRDPSISHEEAARRLGRTVSQIKARRQRERAAGRFHPGRSETRSVREVADALGCQPHALRRIAREHDIGRMIPGLQGRRFTDADVKRLAELWRQRQRTEPESDDERFYSVIQAGEILGVSRQRVDQLIRQWFPEWLERPESPMRLSRIDITQLNRKRLSWRKGRTIKVD